MDFDSTYILCYIIFYLIIYNMNFRYSFLLLLFLINYAIIYINYINLKYVIDVDEYGIIIKKNITFVFDIYNTCYPYSYTYNLPKLYMNSYNETYLLE